MIEPWVFILLVLAAYRLTRFVVFDSLLGSNVESGTKWSAKLDAWAFDPYGVDRSFLRGKAGTLLVCAWCAGFHVSLVLVCLFTRLLPWQLGVDGWIGVWAVAAGQGMAHVIERRLTR